MYLAKLRYKRTTTYVIRQSIHSSAGHYIPQDLFHLGTDPTKFIHYPGGNGYYYDPCIEEAISGKCVEFNPNDLDRIFFEFLAPEIQRVITGFDRSYRTQSNLSQDTEIESSIPIHIFDKRRFHYLRFGHSGQHHIDKVPEKIFRPLQGRSRDELEHYFRAEEGRLRLVEHGTYLSIIFRLNDFTPDKKNPLVTQLDAYFIDRLCRLNSDERFLAGEPKPKGLYEHLVKYAIIFFDYAPSQQDFHWQYIRDFINRHRTYRPSAKTRVKTREAEQLFGRDWTELKRMGRVELTRRYRKLALKYHPDQGGDAGTFGRLTQTYKSLMQRKPKR